MNDPLKYETRHLLFEVGRSIYVTFYYFIVIMNRWKQYEEFWTLWLLYLHTPCFLQQSIAHFVCVSL